MKKLQRRRRRHRYRNELARRAVRTTIEQLEDRRLLATWFGTIPDGTVWSAGEVHELVADVFIQQGSTVTVEPGAIVKARGGVDVTVDGTLTAIGSADQQITFTSIRDDFGGDTNGDADASSPGRGDWNRILVRGSADFEHVAIRYGGSTGALTIDSGDVSLKSSSISESHTHGVRIGNADPTIADVFFKNNRFEAVSMALDASPDFESLAFENNRTNGIAVDAGELTRDTIWNAPQTAFVFVGDVIVPESISLTILPDTVIKPGAFNRGLIVNGELDARGTADEPITFTSKQDDAHAGDTDNDGTASPPAKGQWETIKVTGTAILEHVHIHYADALGALQVDNGDVTFNNGSITHSDVFGMKIIDSTPTIRNVDFRNNDNAAISMTLDSNPELENLTFTNNQINGVRVDGGNSTGDLLLDDPGVVYVLGDGSFDLNIAGDMMLAPGQVVKVDGANRDITVNGTFLAEGTPTAQPVLTSFVDDRSGGDTNNDGSATSPAPNQWGTLSLKGPNNRIDNAVIINGGFGTFGSSRISLALDAAAVTIGDSHIQGIRVLANGSATLSGNLVGSGPNALSVMSDGAATISPGTVFKLEDGSRMFVGANGSLTADGSLDEPIHLTSVHDTSVGVGSNGRDAAPGDWDFIDFDGGDGMFDHVHFNYGGGALGFIRVRGSLFDMDISNSSFMNSETAGFVTSFGANQQVSTITNSVFAGNETGIVVAGSHLVRVVNSTIDDNQYGLFLTSDTQGTGRVEIVNSLVTGSAIAGIDAAGDGSVSIANSNVFNTGALNYKDMGDRTGQDGNLSVDPRYFNAANRVYQLAALSPVLDAGDGDAAPATDALGNGRFDAIPLDTGKGAPPFTDLGAFERQAVFTANTDLAASGVTIPAAALQGDTIDVSFEVTNEGDGVARGSWLDGIYLSADNVFSPNDVLIGEALHQGAVGPGGSYSTSVSGIVPGLLPGDYFVIARPNSQHQVLESSALANNAAASLATIAIDLPELNLGVPRQFPLTSTSDRHFFKVPIHDGQDLQVNLDGEDGATNELFVRYGDLPSRQLFDRRGIRAGEADQSVSVGSTSPGNYYVLIHGADVPAQQTLTIEALSRGLAIDSITPAVGSTAGSVTINVMGSHFRPDTSLRLVDGGGNTIDASSVFFSDTGLISGTFDLTAADLGLADVVVSSNGTSTILGDGFEIVDGSTGRLEATISLPDLVRIDRPFAISIDYRNMGEADLVAPVVQLTTDSIVDLSLNKDMVGTSRTLEMVAINPSGPAGILPPGIGGRLTVYGRFSQQGEADYDLLIAEYPQAPIDWSALEAELRPDGISDEDWNALFAQLQIEIGNSWDGYQSALADAVTLLPPSLGRNYSLNDIFPLVGARALATLETSVSGTVYLNDTDQPAGDLEVRLTDSSQQISIAATSHNDGSFLFPTVPDGTYAVTVVGGVPVAPIDPIQVAGEDVDFQIVVSPGTHLSGQVVRNDGAAVVGASVRAITNSGQTFVTQTANDGSWSLTGLPAASYEVIAIPGSELLSSQSRALTVGENEFRGNFNLILAPAGLIAGIVSGPDGVLADADVTAIGSDGMTATATTAANGEFQIGGLTEQDYTLLIRKAGFATTRTAAGAVTARRSTDAGSLVLAAGGGLGGSVADALGGTGLAGVLIELTDGSQRFHLETNDSGSFSLDDLPAGTFDLTATSATHQTVRDTVTITAGEDANWTTTLTQRGTVGGRITDSLTTDPIRKVVVFASQAGLEVASAVTDDNGEYALTGLDGGTYLVTFGDLSSEGIDRGEITVDDVVFEHTLDFTAQVSGIISGKVFESDGSTPRAGVEIGLVRDDAVISSMLSEDDGAFAFVTFADGQYSLEAVDVGAVFPSIGPLSTTGGTELTGRNFTAGSQTISGQITAADDGSPVGDAIVVLVNTDAGRVSANVAMVATDPNGDWQLDGVSSGAFEVLVVAPGFELADQPVAVNGSSVSGVDFSIGDENLLTGVVRDNATSSVVPTASVIAYADGSTTSPVIAPADDNGAFSVPALGPGHYDLIVMAPGFETLLVDDVHVPVGGLTTTFDLSESLTSLSGNISAAVGPLAGAAVSAHLADGRVVNLATTNEHGDYQLTGLPPGTLSLNVRSAGYLPETRAITISPGSDLTNEDVSLTAGATVDFKIASGVRAVLDGESSVVSRVITRPSFGFTIDPLLNTEQDHEWKERTRQDILRRVDAVEEDYFANIVPGWNANSSTLIAMSNQTILKGLETKHKILQGHSATRDRIEALWTTRKNAIHSLLPSVEHVKKNVGEEASAKLFAAVAASDPLLLELAPIRQVSLRAVKVDPVAPIRAALDSWRRAEIGLSGRLTAEEILAQIGDPLRQFELDLDRALNAARTATQSAVRAFVEPLSLWLDDVRTIRADSQEIIHDLRGAVDFTSDLLVYYASLLDIDIYYGKYEYIVSLCEDWPDPPGPDGSGADGTRNRGGGSGDPNDKHGPAAFGQSGFTRTKSFSYEVQFENDANAGATLPAVEVFITDTLDEDLDLPTFEFGSFGFGYREFPVPSGLQHYESTIDLRSSGDDLLVTVELDLDTDTRVVGVTLRSLDPLTLDLPDNPLAGFLPVNDKQLHNGEGFFRYTVQPKPDLPTGTQILNQASIVFDTNAAILTPETTHTIDDGRPASSIDQLPPEVPLDFDVSWTGNDDINGSGVAQYDVYVSENDGPFTLWQAATTETTATFLGASNNATYAFYSVAVDNAGNLENVPLSADTQTTVRATPWQNPRNHLNVDDDAEGKITPIDVLLIINEINRRSAAQQSSDLPVPPQPDFQPPPYFDVNGDNSVSPVDVLIVINFINNQPSGDGESLGPAGFYGRVIDGPGTTRSMRLEQTGWPPRVVSETVAERAITEDSSGARRLANSPALVDRVLTDLSESSDEFWDQLLS